MTQIESLSAAFPVGGTAKNRKFSRKKKSSRILWEQATYVFVMCAYVNVCLQVIPAVHSVSWVHGDVCLGKLNVLGHMFHNTFGPF